MSISIDNAMYSSYINSDSSKKLDSVSKDYSKATDDELMEACKEFEAYFIEQVFKGMEKTIPKSEESDDNTMAEYFKEELISKYAKKATDAGNGLGIAQMLYEQMKRNVAEEIGE